MKWLVDKFLIWWLKSGRYKWSKIRRKLFERKYLKTELPSVTSFEEIETYLKQITWTMDGPLHLFDSISYPQAVWARKKDDCDGFAVLACELLAQLDSSLEPYLVTAMVHPVKKSHSVCVFSYSKEELGVFDNGKLKKGYITDGEVIDEIRQKSEGLICWDVRRHEDFGLIEFHINR